MVNFYAAPICLFSLIGFGACMYGADKAAQGSHKNLMQIVENGYPVCQASFYKIGKLIKDKSKFLLTASHCVCDTNSKVQRNGILLATNQWKTFPDAPVHYKIKRTFCHHTFSQKDTTGYDIALIEADVDQPFNLNEDVSAITISREKIAISQENKCVVASWGVNDTWMEGNQGKYSYPEVLQEAYPKEIKHCFPNWQNSRQDNTFCTSWDGKPFSTLPTDSGAILTCKQAGHVFGVGVLSSGSTFKTFLANKQHPEKWTTIFTDLTNYRQYDWIHDNTEFWLHNSG